MNLFGGNSNNGIKGLVADVAISGLVYVLPESGDQINLFMIEIQSGTPQPGTRKRSGAAKAGKTAQARYGFASGSDCQLLGSIQLKDIGQAIGAKDKIKELFSVRGQLLLVSQ